MSDTEKSPEDAEAHADLSGADLFAAALRFANLDGANLEGVREDLHEVLAATPNEVPGLLRRIEEGRINGMWYQGDCACLVGSLARERGVRHTEIPGLTPDPNRPAERWFLAIQPGHTPARSPVAAITADWVREWLAEGHHD